MRPSRPTDQQDSLAFMPWFPRDWRASTGRAVMSALGRGIYRELLDAAWLEGGSLPRDERTLIAVAGCTPQEWRKVRDEVLERFTVTADDRLQQDRLAWQYQRAADLRDKQRTAAEKVNALRRGQRDGERDTERLSQRDGERTGQRAQPEPEPEPEPEPRVVVEGDGRNEPAAPATATTEDQDRELVEVEAILGRLQALGFDLVAELRRASYMPPKGRHASRWATTAAELSGRWRSVTLAALRRTEAEAISASAAPSEPDQPHADPEADAAWTQVLDELTLAERAGVKAPSPQSVARWLRPLVPVALQPGRLLLASPSPEHARHVPATYGPAVSAAAARLELTVLLDHAVMGQQAQEVTP